MNVFMINKYLYPRGGDAIVTLNTGAMLRRSGHNVVFWGMNDHRNEYFPHTDLFLDNMDLAQEQSFRSKLEISANILYSRKAKQKLEQLIQRLGKPDIVHLNNFAHQISPSILDVLNKYQIPAVMTIHDSKLVCGAYSLLSHGRLCDRCRGGRHWNCFKHACVKGSRAKSLLTTLEMTLHHNLWNIYGHIDMFISPSTFMKNKMTSMGFKFPIRVVPNCVEANDFVPIEPGRRVDAIGYVGRLTEEKGVGTLIKAMLDVPQIELHIIGDGEARDKYHQMVREHNATHIKFKGYLKGDTLKQELSLCDFVVCPSECYDNYPTSVIESFALGKPVIGSSIGGIPELVRNGETGYLFGHGQVQALQDAILRLAHDPVACRRMGQRARQWVEQELSSDIYCQRILQIYSDVVQKRKGRKLAGV